MPAGWEASPTWKGLALRPASPDLRRQLAQPVQMDTSYLEAFYNPAGLDLYQDGSELPKGAMAKPRGRQSRGSFPAGRGWFRTDERDGRWRTTNWYVSWPYHCERAGPCPDVLAMRTLRVALRVDDGAWPQMAGLAQRLLGTARPIANAVAGQRHAPRPACVDGQTVVSRRTPDVDPVEPAAVSFGWTFRTTVRMVPCVLRAPLAVEILTRDRPAQVGGNADPVTPTVELPEGAEPAEVGRAGLSWRWTNWCGGPTQVRWLDAADPDSGPAQRAPGCNDPSRPSVLHPP